MNELCALTAVELASRLRTKQVSAREVVEAHLARIGEMNPEVNAIVSLTADQALATADKADDSAARGRFLGPLHGIPVVHKDLHETRGVRTTYGSPIFRDHVPDFDCLLVERTREAGAIMLGKTNTPEFAAGSQTFNPIFGVTRNPSDLTKTCGGSSGGSAVALACHMTPLADGTDTGGSLRNPASFCGVTGIRTSPGRVPRVPTSNPWSRLTVAGPMARNVADLALYLSVIAGSDPRTPISLPEPGSVFASDLNRDHRGTRIAWCANYLGLPFDNRIKAIFEKQRSAFEDLGCVVEDAEPDLSAADEAFRTQRALSFHRQYAHLLRDHRDQIKSTVIDEIERGAALTGAQIAAAELAQARLYAGVSDFMQKYDFFVLPTTQVLPFDVDQPWVTEINGLPMPTYIDWMKSCYYITATTLPAISVPAGLSPEGLPAGIQIVGRLNQDFDLLRIAHGFEQIRFRRYH